MPSGSYERYGLTGNPFRDLAAESLEDVMIYHVNQAVDETLRTIREEVYDKENRAVVAVTGPQGAGKTERLLVSAAEGRERKALVVYFDVTTKMPWVLRDLAATFQKSAKEAGHVKALGAPGWLRPLAGLARSKDVQYDPKETGQAVADALNSAAPSLLLLNDLHNLVESAEVDSFAKMLEEVTDAIKPGVLVMFSCYGSYLAWLTVNHPAFATRINRAMALVALSNEEARLVLAKKLLAKRIVEDLDPTYPYDKEAVTELNTAAHGNPRIFLELCDIVLERAVATRAYRIDPELVRSSLTHREGVVVGGQPVTSDAGRPLTKPSEAKEASSAPARPERRRLWGKPKDPPATSPRDS